MASKPPKPPKPSPKSSSTSKPASTSTSKPSSTLRLTKMRPVVGIASRKVDVAQALKLAMQGYTYTDIGKLMGVTKSAISLHLKPLMDMIGDPAQHRAYRANRADVMDGLQRQLASHLVDPKKIDKATLGNIAYAIRQLNDISRLERDQSTQNIAHAHAEAVRTLEEANAEIARITGEGQTPVNTAKPTGSKALNATMAAVDAEIERIQRSNPAIGPVEDWEGKKSNKSSNLGRPRKPRRVDNG